MRYASVLAAWLVSTGFQGAARADGDNAKAANDAFEKGTAAYNAGKCEEPGTEGYNAGKCEEALDAFDNAYDLRPSWKIYFNIGQCQASLRNWGAALDAFTKYLSNGLDEIPEEKRKAVEKDIDSFRKLVGYLQVSAPQGAKIYADKAYQGEAPLKGMVTVNANLEVKVSAELVGGQVVTQSVMVPNGQTVAVDLTQPEEAAPMNKPEPESVVTTTVTPPSTLPRIEKPPDKRLQVHKVAGWISAGTGGALLIAGAITGGLALGIHSDLKKTCEADVCYKESYDQMDRMNGLATASTTLIVLGGVATAAGAGLLIFWQVKRSKSHETAWIPTPSGMVVKGRF